MEEQVRQAFAARPRLVEGAPGFLGLEVMTEDADPSVFLLVTRWTSVESFRTWHSSEAHHKSHAFIPKGLKLDAAFTSVTIAHEILVDAPIKTLRDAVESQPAAFSEWLNGSNTLFALLVASDGTILARNRAAARIFPASANTDAVGDYLVSQDAEHLQQRLAGSASASDGAFLLNLTQGQLDPVTWEVSLIRNGASAVLVGTQEQRHDVHFQDQVVSLTNDLALTIRNAAQKNRELQRANESIELLVRTDSLTGLANRRMPEETLPRETSRAERLKEELSVIFADLDHFKQINDQFGHKVGDQVLASVGNFLKSQMRAYALASRFGGDEFVLLLPGTARVHAINVAVRMREKIVEMTVPDCPRQITISMGVACLESGETGAEMVARADVALYRAKQKGGNVVEVA